MGRVGFPCYDCVYRREVPGNAHIQCIAPWAPDEVLDVMRNASSHGIKHGWFYFPYVYDPIWAGEWDDEKPGPVECPRFVATAIPAV